MKVTTQGLIILICLFSIIILVLTAIKSYQELIERRKIANEATEQRTEISKASKKTLDSLNRLQENVSTINQRIKNEYDTTFSKLEDLNLTIDGSKKQLADKIDLFETGVLTNNELTNLSIIIEFHDGFQLEQNIKYNVYATLRKNFDFGGAFYASFYSRFESKTHHQGFDIWSRNLSGIATPEHNDGLKKVNHYGSNRLAPNWEGNYIVVYLSLVESEINPFMWLKDLNSCRLDFKIDSSLSSKVKSAKLIANIGEINNQGTLLDEFNFEKVKWIETKLSPNETLVMKPPIINGLKKTEESFSINLDQIKRIQDSRIKSIFQFKMKSN